MKDKESEGALGWAIAIIFTISAILFSGWIYMIVISLFNPISYKNATLIALILNAIGLAFNYGRTMSEKR